MTDASGTSRQRTRAPKSFDDFVQASSPGLLKAGIAVTLDVETAKDLVQDTLLETFRRWDHVSGLDRPDLWSRRVLVNRGIDIRRRQARFRGLLVRRKQASAELGDTVAFWSAIADLPKQQAAVLTLRTAGELSVSEIAQCLDLAEGTVRSHLSAGRATLHRLFDEQKEDA